MEHPRLDVEIYQIADDSHDEAEPHRRHGMGLVLGRLAAGLDGRNAASVMRIAACRSRSSIRRAGGSRIRSASRRPGAGRASRAAIDFRFDAAAETLGDNGSTASSARGSSPGTRRSCFARSRRARGS